MYFDDRSAFPADERRDDDSEEADGWQQPHRPVRYVYDAVAERTMQRIKEEEGLQLQMKLVNGVH